MKRSPKVGETGELSFVVTEQHAIDFANEQMPAVLSTPWLIWFLEHAARNAMLPLLEADESTVGAVSTAGRAAAAGLAMDRESCSDLAVDIGGWPVAVDN